MPILPNLDPKQIIYYLERDRETERQRDRETERQRDRETERQRDRETEIQTYLNFINRKFMAKMKKTNFVSSSKFSLNFAEKLRMCPPHLRGNGISGLTNPTEKEIFWLISWLIAGI
jgi:hypothetical protein